MKLRLLATVAWLATVSLAAPVKAQDTQPADQTCTERGRQQSRFIITGRGGMPPNPYEPLSADEILADVQPPASWASTPAPNNSTSAPSATTPNQVVEARYWVINSEGKVMLTAPAPSLSLRVFIQPQPATVNALSEVAAGTIDAFYTILLLPHYTLTPNPPLVRGGTRKASVAAYLFSIGIVGIAIHRSL